MNGNNKLDDSFELSAGGRELERLVRLELLSRCEDPGMVRYHCTTDARQRSAGSFHCLTVHQPFPYSGQT